MTVSTGNPHAQEELAERAGQFLGRDQRQVDRSGGLVPGRSSHGQDLVDEPVIGHVLCHLPPEPSRDGHRHLGLQFLVVDLQHVGLRSYLQLIRPQNVEPLHRPVVGVLVAFEQSRHQCVSLARRLVGQEGPHGSRGGQRADRVEVSTPHEGGIVGEFTGRDPQCTQPIPHVLVDEVVLGRSLEDDPRLRPGDAADGHLAHVPHQDRRFSGDLGRDDQPATIDPGDHLVVRLVFRLGRHAPGLATGVGGGHSELLLLSGIEQSVGRVDLDRGTHPARHVELGPLGNPPLQAAVAMPAGHQLAASAMRHRGGALGQQQAAVGHRR